MKSYAETLEDPSLAQAVVDLVAKAAGRKDFDIVLIVHSPEGQSMINNVIDRGELAAILEGAAEKARATRPDTIIRPPSVN